MSMAFELHPQLLADSVPVAVLELCDIRLMDAAAVPWLLMIPRRTDLREIIDLDESAQLTLWREIALVSKMLRNEFHPTKLNVAALGNVVPQLHVHVIARFSNDAAWPKPAWGNLPMVPYTVEARDAMVLRLQTALKP
ncbi:MAG: HIT family protein [Turneriella sp.]|nr:HIT family protein [Turneriella sp.]